jgi:hypothetical protein
MLGFDPKVSAYAAAKDGPALSEARHIRCSRFCR